MKRIVLVGHCGPDTSYLMMAARKAAADAQIVRANADKDLASALAGGDGETVLLLVNRVLDGNFADAGGIELIARLRGSHPRVRTMLISNYEDAQRSAVRAGALPGFGKREIGSPKVLSMITSALAADEVPVDVR
jgi:two-component system, chemotaxis family, chemotaxis protein CheY